MKVEIGKWYRNIHTDIICRVTNKHFFNIAYLRYGEPDNLFPHYCHYKRFLKNWVEVPDPNE